MMSSLNRAKLHYRAPRCSSLSLSLSLSLHSGVHHTKECNEDRDAQKVARKLEAQKDSLFPESLHLDLGLNPIASRKKVKPYGGWGDVRDWQLCLSFVGNALRNSL